MSKAAKKTQPQKMTIAEYLDFEYAAELKHEYANGYIVDMAGTTSSTV